MEVVGCSRPQRWKTAEEGSELGPGELDVESGEGLERRKKGGREK